MALMRLGKFAFQIRLKHCLIYPRGLKFQLITPPARRAWRSYKFAPFLFFFPVSKVGAPLMGDTAVHSLSHDFKLNF